jgi:adenylate kinase
LVEGTVISDLFSRLGTSARTRLLILGSLGNSSEELTTRFRSLNIEHVSPAYLLKQEISRRTALGSKAERAFRDGQIVPDEVTFAVLRRWFWTRKPDAGFALTGFPATLLQAKVFDEWLDARGEALDTVLTAAQAPGDVVEHYRTFGLLNQQVGIAA